MPLKDEGSGDLFYKGPRKCERTDLVDGHPATVEKPDRVVWASDGGEFHRCPDGQWGRLVPASPEAAAEVPASRDPRIVRSLDEEAQIR